MPLRTNWYIQRGRQGLKNVNNVPTGYETAFKGGPHSVLIIYVAEVFKNCSVECFQIIHLYDTLM